MLLREVYTTHDFSYLGIVLDSSDWLDITQAMISGDVSLLKAWGERLSDDMATEIQPLTNLRFTPISPADTGIIMPWRCGSWLMIPRIPND